MVTISPQELAKSAAKFRKELLAVPMLALGPALNYMTMRRGIRGSETVGALSGTIEMGPYDESRVDEDKVSISGRTIHNYLGSVVKKFSPNDVVESIYGADINQGEALKSVEITRQVLAFLAAKLGQGLAIHLFDAVRNAKGNRTVDLFNGFDTITAAEITDGAISVENGNLYEFSEAIDSTNAVDIIVDFCRSASEQLVGIEDGGDAKGQGLCLYVPRPILYAYRDDYEATTGHTPVYDKFNQTSVKGFDNIHFVPLAAKAKAPFIQLSRKNNMLIAVNQNGDPKETIAVEKYHPFKLDFVSTLWFGTDYESIEPENLFVGKLASEDEEPVQTPPVPVEPENPDEE